MTRKEFIRGLSQEEKVQIIKEYKDSGIADISSLDISDLKIEGLWREKCNELYKNVGDNYTLVVFARDVAEELAFDYVGTL